MTEQVSQKSLPKKSAKKRRFFRKPDAKTQQLNLQKKAKKAQNAAPANKENKKSPSNSRSFTETFSQFASYIEKHWIVIGITMVTVFLLSLVVVTAVDTYMIYVQKKQVDSQRQALEDQVGYWKGIVVEHKDYRDAYFQLALLEYQLRDLESSRMYLKKVFELDPNFEKGKELEELLN